VTGAGDEQATDLLAKVGAWLHTEGYPLEFATASMESSSARGERLLIGVGTRPEPVSCMS
jgi:hypothetical protein